MSYCTSKKALRWNLFILVGPAYPISLHSSFHNNKLQESRKHLHLREAPRPFFFLVWFFVLHQLQCIFLLLFIFTRLASLCTNKDCPQTKTFDGPRKSFKLPWRMLSTRVMVERTQTLVLMFFISIFGALHARNFSCSGFTNRAFFLTLSMISSVIHFMMC